MDLKIGDIVTRKSYDGDVFFKVADILNNGVENIVTLKGVSCRLEADAPESDLIVINEHQVDRQDSCVKVESGKKAGRVTSFFRVGGRKK